ncbi:MAG TPA: pitrilysin family protein [Candidatus Cybelea sp.]|nr:pitrilysin family protein [Candidatus Cybelea sp.]
MSQTIYRSLAAAVLVIALLISLPLRATEIQPVTSPGGIKAWLVREPSIPIIAIELAWRNAGSRLDPAAKAGLANLASGLLDEGAGDMDSQAFQTKVDSLGLELGFSAGHDHFRASLRTLSENRVEAFRLLGLALSAPRFDAEPLERIRNQIQVRLTRQEEDPDVLASRALMAAAFPGNAYGRPVDGTIASVGQISHDDLVDFMHRRLARDNVVIGVVGDISAAELGPLLDSTLGGLAAKAEVQEGPDVKAAAVAAPIVITRDIPQSVIAFAGPGIKRSDPDFYAAFVLNYVLGSDSLNSRLAGEVRIKRGLAYSIGTSLALYDRAALQVGEVATRNEKVGEMLKVVRDVLARVRESGITAEELADAKTYLNGSFPRTLSSNSRIANFIVQMQLDRLGIDYLDRRAGLIDSVTLDDVKRVAGRLIDPATMTVVVVGKPQGLGG